ncbi:MAG: hypothetical protein ABL977_00895 [Candidatus Eisenbacteria bacterium]
MTEPQSLTHHAPVVAGPVRRAWHTLVALAGWVLFIYWWWIVFQRVSRDEVRWTLWFIGLALAAIVLSTALWAAHNLRVWKRKGPRIQLRDITPDFSHDTIGRRVDLPGVPEDCRTAAVVVVRIEDGAKVYRPLPPRGGAPGRTAKIVSLPPTGTEGSR